MGKLFDTVLLLLLVGSAVVGEGWLGVHPGSTVPDWLLRGATGVMVCVTVLKLKRLAQESKPSTVPSLRLLGTGVVLLGIEQFDWQYDGYLSVLGAQ